MYLVQIGCHTGDDQFLDLVKSKAEEIEKVLVVDALKSSVDKCKDLYKKTFNSEVLNKICFVHRAVVDDDSVEEIPFFFPRGEHSADGKISYTAFSSTNRNHLVAHGVKDIDEVKVKASTLGQLLEEFGFPRVDRLYLDAEGLDAKILLSTELDKDVVPFICFEGAHTDGSFNRSVNFAMLKSRLDGYGYKTYTFYHTSANEGYTHDQLDWNCWAINDESLKDELIKYSGHAEKIKLGWSRLIEI